MYNRILVATDGSPLSKKAVSAAISLAALTGAELVALTVVPRYPMSYFEGGMSISPQEVSRVEQAWSDNARQIVDAVTETAMKKGIKAKAVVTRSDLVAEAVIAAASKHKSDLIIMASHGRKGLKRVLLGSETQHVLTHSTVPVLVLR
ncbi:MAG: universal stress protein [Bdellovibrionales bacterium]|nr:universal stress protein [Ramlibacter sp.]